MLAAGADRAGWLPPAIGYVTHRSVCSPRLHWSAAPGRWFAEGTAPRARGAHLGVGGFPDRADARSALVAVTGSAFPDHLTPAGRAAQRILISQAFPIDLLEILMQELFMVGGGRWAGVWEETGTLMDM